ncbi:MAG: hypothetical protein FWC87_00070 [Acidimicrobiaceae bacterium]|nr:hypothetical protein [Acidimicrobiaceae bacterium]
MTQFHYFAESLGQGRAILRRDVVHHGRLVESHTIGSPAPIASVKAFAARMSPPSTPMKERTS